MSNVIIRLFKAQDRQAVRDICCATADGGEPIDRLFPDQECAADLLTMYYTDYEPQTTFVAEADGKVVGYVNGCLDNRRYGLVIGCIIVPKLLLKAFIRGLFFTPAFSRLMQSAWRNWRRLFSWRKESFHSHQSHMHIGIAKDFRRQDIGQKLVNALVAFAKSQRVQELTASVHDDNIAACHFFERQGFTPQRRYFMVDVWGKPYQSVLYVKSII